MNIGNIEIVANLIKKHTEPHTFNGNVVSGYHYIFDKYDVYIDSFHNRYIESKDNSFHLVFLKGNGFTAKWVKHLMKILHIVHSVMKLQILKLLKCVEAFAIKMERKFLALGVINQIHRMEVI